MFRRPNAVFTKGKIVATKMIRAGDTVRLATSQYIDTYVKLGREPLHREGRKEINHRAEMAQEERREIDRLAEMAREHAFRN